MQKFSTMKRVIRIFTIILLVISGLQAFSQKEIYYFKIDEDIAKPALRKTEIALEYVKSHQIAGILLEINTFGGEMESAEKIRTLLLEAPVPVYLFINKNAASAGALISIACDSIYMSPGASIGAASVVNQAGEIMPDKYQSYMRSLMRATAEKNGRNPLIAEAMVDPDTQIDSISPKGKVLTFTTQEAIKNNYCEGQASSKEEVLALIHHSSSSVTEQELSWVDSAINFLINPIVSGILIMLIIGGIYFELQSPGLGLPIIIAVSAALLYFAPHYLQGLATHWEILLFIVGLILLIIEFFVIPGFGFIGISGIILMVLALIFSMIFNIGFDFNYAPRGEILNKFFVVISSLIVGFFISLWLGKKLFTTTTRYGALALNTELEGSKGFVAQDIQISDKVGKHGTTLTFMRPVGKIEIDGEIFDATSEAGVIEKGESVIVTRFENSQLFITKA